MPSISRELHTAQDDSRKCRVEEQMSTDMDGETALGAGPASSTRRRTTGSKRRRACHGSSGTPYR